MQLTIIFVIYSSATCFVYEMKEIVTNVFLRTPGDNRTKAKDIQITLRRKANPHIEEA